MSWSSKAQTQTEYLAELEKQLNRLPIAERADILRDQDEFFREALLSGRTVADVIGSLGDPKQLARTLIAESHLSASETAFKQKETSSLSNKVNTTLRAFIAILTLAPFNLIFVLGPFLLLMLFIFIGWALGGAMTLAGVASLLFVANNLLGVGASFWAHISSVFLGLSITMISLALLGLMALVTSWVAQASVRYLRWNLDLIAQRK